MMSSLPGLSSPRTIPPMTPHPLTAILVMMMMRQPKLSQEEGGAGAGKASLHWRLAGKQVAVIGGVSLRIDLANDDYSTCFASPLSECPPHCATVFMRAAVLLTCQQHHHAAACTAWGHSLRIPDQCWVHFVLALAGTTLPRVTARNSQLHRSNLASQHRALLHLSLDLHYFFPFFSFN